MIKFPYLIAFILLSIACTNLVYAQDPNNMLPKSNYFLNVADFGAVGDGKTDDTAAFLKAAKLKKPIYIPATKGGYLVSKPLDFYADVHGEHMAHSRIIFAGTGWAITMYGGSTFGVAIQNLTVESSRGRKAHKVNQSGIRIMGTTHNRIQSVRTIGFDGNHVQLANRDKKSGCFWGRFSEIYCILWSGQKGNTGIYITGREKLLPGNSGVETTNSNANIFENIVVSGNFEMMFYIGGNNNKFLGGTAQWADAGETIKYIYYVNGSGNWIHSPYIESADGSFPQSYIYFGPDSRNNRFEHLHNQFYINSNYDSKITDKGIANLVDIPNTLYGMTALVDNSQNLIENSDFKVVKNGVPYGWATRGQKITMDEGQSFEGAGIVNFELSNSYEELNYRLIKGDKSISTYESDFFAGKTLSFSIQAKSNVSNIGQLRIYCQNKSGNITALGRTSHSGSNEWEQLSVFAKIPDDVDQIIISIMSSIQAKKKLTGTVLFAKPIVSLSGQTKNNNFRYMTETGGNLYGDINMLSGEIIRMDDKGVKYKLSFPNGEGEARWVKVIE